MVCRSKLLLLTAVFLGAAAGMAGAGVPDPDLCTVPKVLTSPSHPDVFLDYEVSVVGADGPIDSALVQLVFSPVAAGLICWCNGQTQPIIEGYTNVSGVVIFQISGGGCLDPALTVDPPVQVFANGMLIKEVGVASVDVVDGGGRLPTTVGYDPAGNCQTALSDATFITPAIKSGSLTSYCTDLDASGATNLADAVLFTPAIKVGYICTQAP